jgi:hypothetical protein
MVESVKIDREAVVRRVACPDVLNGSASVHRVDRGERNAREEIRPRQGEDDDSATRGVHTDRGVEQVVSTDFHEALFHDGPGKRARTPEGDGEEPDPHHREFGRRDGECVRATPEQTVGIRDLIHPILARIEQALGLRAGPMADLLEPGAVVRHGSRARFLIAATEEWTYVTREVEIRLAR